MNDQDKSSLSAPDPLKNVTPPLMNVNEITYRLLFETAKSYFDVLGIIISFVKT